MPPLSPDYLQQALSLLASEMEREGIESHDLVVCGGSALLALNFSRRTTRDVDIIARLDAFRNLIEPRPLSPGLLAIADRIGRLLDLPPNWLNAEPADQLQCGLPAGFVDRLHRVEFGPALRVYFTDRYDLIHLKLFALVDQGPGKHLQDLTTLYPSKDELLAAARWVLTQDAGQDFPAIVRALLIDLGHDDIAGKL